MNKRKYFTLTIKDFKENIYFLSNKYQFELITLNEAYFADQFKINDVGNKLVDEMDLNKFDIKTMRIIEINIIDYPFGYQLKNVKG